MKRATILMLGALALAAGPVVGGDKIYRTTDEDGNVIYTDEPPSEDAEAVDLEPLTTVPAPEEPAEDTSADDDGERADDQQQAQQDGPKLPRGLRIAYPPGDEPVRHNGGNVPFRVELDPKGARLPPGHRIQIVIDGEARASGSGAEIVVSPVNRGPHTARARLVDDQGQPRMTSAPVKFYLLRAATGERANPGQSGQQGPSPQGQSGQQSGGPGRQGGP